MEEESEERRLHIQTLFHAIFSTYYGTSGSFLIILHEATMCKMQKPKLTETYIHTPAWWIEADICHEDQIKHHQADNRGKLISSCVAATKLHSLLLALLSWKKKTVIVFDLFKAKNFKVHLEFYIILLKLKWIRKTKITAESWCFVDSINIINETCFFCYILLINHPQNGTFYKDSYWFFTKKELNGRKVSTATPLILKLPLTKVIQLLIILVTIIKF